MRSRMLQHATRHQRAALHAELAEGAREHALKFADFPDVQRLEAALSALEATAAATWSAGGSGTSGGKPVVTLVGAGYAGVCVLHIRASVMSQTFGPITRTLSWPCCTTTRTTTERLNQH